MCMHHVAVTPILSTLDGSYDYPQSLATTVTWPVIYLAG